jgi:geranylgeranyl reductase family protein
MTPPAAALRMHTLAAANAADFTDRLWDAIVVGAGPAGATAAAHLSHAGHAVLLIDRHRFPRDKVCGDALIADSIRALGRMGALQTVRTSAFNAHTVSVYSPSRVRVDIRGDFLTIKRTDLDALVVAQSVDAGATLAVGTVTDLQPVGDRVHVRLDGGLTPLTAKYAVLATGADPVLPFRSGVVGETNPSAIALRCYVRSPVRLDRLLISYDRSILPGYAWIFPLGEGEFNVGCGVFRNGVKARVNLRQTFERFVTGFPEARAVMEAGVQLTPLKGAQLRCGLNGCEPAKLPRTLAIGEAIAATYPFTGEGIGKAMETGELAAEILGEAIRTGESAVLSSFPARLHARVGARYFTYRVAERWLARPWLNDLIARRTRRSSFLQRAVTGLLNETVDPRIVFSVRGLARSFLG